MVTRYLRSIYLGKKFTFFGVLKVMKEKSRIRIRNPVLRIRMKAGTLLLPAALETLQTLEHTTKMSGSFIKTLSVFRRAD
jgi:hypothetical protein